MEISSHVCEKKIIKAGKVGMKCHFYPYFCWNLHFWYIISS